MRFRKGDVYGIYAFEQYFLPVMRRDMNLKVDENNPVVNWVDPTPEDDSSTNDDWVHLNVTVEDISDKRMVVFDWDDSILA